MLRCSTTRAGCSRACSTRPAACASRRSTPSASRCWAAFPCAAQAVLGGGGGGDQERGAAISAGLADPPARVAAFADYLCAFFTQEGKPFQDILSKGLAAKEPSVAAAVAAEAERLAAVKRRRSAPALHPATAPLGRLPAALLTRH